MIPHQVHRPREGGDRLVHHSLTQIDATQVVLGLGVAGFVRQGLVIGGDGLLRLSRGGQHGAEGIVRLSRIRGNRNGLPQRMLRLGQPSLPMQLAGLFKSMLALNVHGRLVGHYLAVCQG